MTLPGLGTPWAWFFFCLCWSRSIFTRLGTCWCLPRSWYWYSSFSFFWLSKVTTLWLEKRMNRRDISVTSVHENDYSTQFMHIYLHHDTLVHRVLVRLRCIVRCNEGKRSEGEKSKDCNYEHQSRIHLPTAEMLATNNSDVDNFMFV